MYPGETVLFDAATGRELHRLPHVIFPHISPAGTQLVVAGDGVADSDLRLFAVDRDALTRVLLPRAIR